MSENSCFSRKGPYNEVSQILSVGVLDIYYPKLQLVKEQLHELTNKQETLYNELHIENLKFSEASYSVDLHDMFKKIKYYREKLVSIKQSMALLHDQSTKLKKRALKLAQQKQKEALNKVEERENEELLIDAEGSFQGKLQIQYTFFVHQFAPKAFSKNAVKFVQNFTSKKL